MLYRLSDQGNPKHSRNSFPWHILPFPQLIYFSRSALLPQSSHHAGWHCVCGSHYLEYSSLTSSAGSSYPSFKTRMSVISSMSPFLTPLGINCVNTAYHIFIYFSTFILWTKNGELWASVPRYKTFLKGPQQDCFVTLSSGEREEFSCLARLRSPRTHRGSPRTHRGSRSAARVSACGLPTPSCARCLCGGRRSCPWATELKCWARHFPGVQAWSASQWRGQHSRSKWNLCQDFLKLRFFISHTEEIRQEAKWEVRQIYWERHSVEERVPSQKVRGLGRHTFHGMWSLWKDLRAASYFYHSPHDTMFRTVSPTIILNP